MAEQASIAELFRSPELMRAIAKQLPQRRWFASKARTIRSLEVIDVLTVAGDFALLLIKVAYTSGGDEIYLLPLGIAADMRAQEIAREHAGAVWAELALEGGGKRVVYEPTADADFCQALLALIASDAIFDGAAGKLAGHKTKVFSELCGDSPAFPRLLSSEQSNSSIAYGDRLIVKLFRKVEIGTNPDFEISAFLTAHAFRHSPPLAGSIEYRRAGEEPWALAIAQGFVANDGNAWDYLAKKLAMHLAQRAANQADDALAPLGISLTSAAGQPIPPSASTELEAFLSLAERLGTRTAELHLTLAAGRDSAFQPEPFDGADAKSFVERAVSLVRDSFDLLRQQSAHLKADVRQVAERVAALEYAAAARFDTLTGEPPRVEKIRVHGDYHLGQVLVADDDFLIIDFEGEPARSLAERREKQLALRDVAGMIRSFHYAGCAAAVAAQAPDAPARAAIDRWTRSWYFWISTAFLRAYRQTAGEVGFLPKNDAQFARVLDACLLQKAIYELRYELNNRPDWVHLPLVALDDLLGQRGAPGAAENSQ